MGMFLLWATWAHEYMDIFLNISGNRTWGRVERAGVCDFDKTWTACQ